MDIQIEAEPLNKKIKLEPTSDAAPATNGVSSQPIDDPSAPPPSTAAAAQLPSPLPVRDTYCTREQRSVDREESGELKAMYAWNDGSPENSKILIGLKNVFAKCLPNMPKTYISRLVFDRRHRSTVIVRASTGKVIAGITYRPFHDRRFAEIAFCAVAQTLQVSGFGTRLMNWTKYYAREKDACEYFLTYADNAAVGYFSKQGFTKNLTMTKDRWHGYIKDYDGGTLMECFIHPTLPFTEIPKMIKTQRTALESAIQQYATAHIVHPGIARWKANPMVDPLPLGEIPGVKEAGWKEAAVSFQYMVGEVLVPPTRVNLTLLMHQLIEQLREEKDLIWPFLEPVSKELAPDYYDIIKNPVDLKTIQNNVEKGNLYVTLDIFAADVQRMFSNAKIYNSADTFYYKAAFKLSGQFAQWVHAAVHYDMPATTQQQ